MPTAMAQSPKNRPTAILFASNSLGRRGRARQPMANKMICTEAATKPHTIKFTNPTLCTMAEAKARQKPATAPPNWGWI